MLLSAQIRHNDFTFNGACFANPAAVKGVDLCAVCHMNKRCANNVTCSRRCEWYNEGRCPQCGKFRTAATQFCSFGCATTSAQANWCPACAIRQCTMGHDHCSESCALIAPAVDYMRRPTKFKYHSTKYDRLKWLNPSELRRIKGLQISAGNRVMQCESHPSRLRAYLAYRTAVEKRLVANQLPKVGHGGEGNELRRFVPLSLSCMMSEISPETCQQTTCGTCRILGEGFSLASSGRGSHYARGSIAEALPWCTPNAAGQKAVAIVRAVIGFPQILRDSNDIKSPWDEGYDSVTVTNGNDAEDGTYLFFDYALDLQYIVFL